MPKLDTEVQVDRPLEENPDDQVEVRFEKTAKGDKPMPAEITLRWQGKEHVLKPGQSVRMTRRAAKKQQDIMNSKHLTHGANITILELKAQELAEGDTKPLTAEELAAAAEGQGMALISAEELEALKKKAAGSVPEGSNAQGGKVAARAALLALAQKFGVENAETLSYQLLVEAISKAGGAVKPD